VCKRTPN
jgi:hypothetical protein